MGYKSSVSSMGAEQKRALWGMMRRGRIVVPTWRGWLLLCCVLSSLAWVGVLETYPFLALSDPRPGGVLVIEGWTPDSYLKEVVAEFHRNHYDKVYVVGGPLDKGALLLDYKTFPELTASMLLKLGMDSNDLVRVTAGQTHQDRTYASAVALKQWWHDHQQSPARVNLMCIGPHARRSRLLFEKTLAGPVTVGVVTLPARDFDSRHWWRSSAGFRVVSAEAIGYMYVRLFFHEPEDPSTQYYADRP